MKARNFLIPSADCNPKSRRLWTQPSPKWPYITQRYPYDSMSFLRERKYTPSFSGATAESSHPSHVDGSPGTFETAPSEDSRTSHTFRARWGSVSKRKLREELPPKVSIARRAFDSASRAVFAPNSASNQPPPGGSSARPSELIPFLRV